MSYAIMGYGVYDPGVIQFRIALRGVSNINPVCLEQYIYAKRNSNTLQQFTYTETFNQCTHRSEFWWLGRRVAMT